MLQKKISMTPKVNWYNNEYRSNYQECFPIVGPLHGLFPLGRAICVYEHSYGNLGIYTIVLMIAFLFRNKVTNAKVDFNSEMNNCNYVL